jgi:ankyrin repeat protein
MMGWTTNQDFIEAKRLIDETTLMAPQISIFQPMFFEWEEPGCFLSASHGICKDYEQQVFMGLMATVKNTNSYEAFRQLMRYFPMPEGFSYSRLRSIAYRKLMYGIKETAYPDELFDLKELDEAAAGQMADIENYYLEGNALALDHSPLHYAVCSGFPEAVSLMLQSEDFQELENVDGLGFTPLLSACRLGSYKIAKLLICAGANVRARTEHGETILHFLGEFESASEMSEIAELIMERGGSELVNTICIKRSFPNEYLSIMIYLIGAPLNTAIMRGNLPLVEILLKYGADPCQGMPQLKALSEYGRDSRMTGVNNGSPLHTAAASHSCEVLKMFWDAFPWSKEWKEWTNGRLLHLAIDGFPEFQKQYIHGPLRRKMMVDTIDLLLDRLHHLKAPVRINGGMPVVFFVTERGTASTLEHLVLRTNSLDINTYFDGLTPIHIAVRRGINEIFNVLIKYGGNPHFGPIKKPVASTLSYCCTCPDSTKEMLKCLLEREVGKQDDGRYPDTITHALAAGKLQEASMILAAGADVDELTTKGEEGWTTVGLLVRGCAYNSIALMSFLIDHEFALGRRPAGFMAVPSLRWTVLHVIAFTPLTSPFYDRTVMSNILDYILNKFDSPENLNAQDHHGWTALHYAAAHANSIAVRRLLALDGIDATLRTSDGESVSVYELSQRRAAMGIPEVVQSAGPRAERIYTKEIDENIALLEPFRECEQWNDSCTPTGS